MASAVPAISEQDFANSVDALLLGQEPEAKLLELLPQHHEIYRGRSELAVVRMRGYVLARMATLEKLGQEVLPFIREELELGHHQYLIAAAARALVKVRDVPIGWQAIVDQTIRRLVSEELLQFESYPLNVRPRKTTTAIKELNLTRHMLQAPSNVDQPPRLSLSSTASFKNRVSLTEATLEDHDGLRLTYGDFFVGQPSFLFFFYTRCNNPNKCSANVWRWGELVRTLHEKGLGRVVRSAAISYDPDFDTPSRLLAYAKERNVPLDENHRVFRVPDRFFDFQRAFQLSVGYSQVTVNSHASEAFLLGLDGKLAAEIKREAWSVEQILGELSKLAPRSSATSVSSA